MALDGEYFREYRRYIGFTAQQPTKDYLSAKDIIADVDYKYVDKLIARLRDMYALLNSAIHESVRHREFADFTKHAIDIAYERIKSENLIGNLNNQGRRLFTCTVVFKPIDIHNYQSRFEDAYKSRFLHKIRRRLDRSKSRHSTSIPFDHLFYFERNHKTLLRSSSKKSPFHIHSVIPIKTHQVHRFWSYEENRLNSRLKKDLSSIDIVDDVFIKPVRDTGSFPWLMYITKQKSF